PPGLQGHLPCENGEGPCVHEEMVWLPTSRCREGDELNYSITSSTHSTGPHGRSPSRPLALVSRRKPAHHRNCASRQIQKSHGVRGCHGTTVSLRSPARTCRGGGRALARFRCGGDFRRPRSRSRLGSSPSIPARLPPAASNRWRARPFTSKSAAA